MIPRIETLREKKLVGMRLKSVAQSRAERSIVDRAADLKQEIGTAFLMCRESGASDLHRAALADRTRARRTTLTRAYTGRLARMLRGLFVQEQVSQRMLARPDGERRLTNLRHLAECLHEASQEHATPEALLGRRGCISRLQQGQGGQHRIVLHRALRQHAVRDARVGFEGGALCIEGLLSRKS